MLLFLLPSRVIFQFFQRVDATHNPYLHNLISVQLPRSTRSSSLVTVARPPTSSSFISICLTLSLESTPYFSLSTSSQSLCLWHAFSCSCHIFWLCQLTTLTTHNSHSLSLPAQDLPLSQISPTIDSFGLRTDSTDFMTDVRFFLFNFLHYSFCILWPVRQIKLATRQLWTHDIIVYCMILYLPHDSTAGGSVFGTVSLCFLFVYETSREPLNGFDWLHGFMTGPFQRFFWASRLFVLVFFITSFAWFRAAD